jgi:hypothetical protein
MEYRAKGSFEWLTWLLLQALVWTGVIGVAWKLLKPGGWLYWTFDQFERNQPVSIYYLAVGVIGLLVGKFWLDSIDPRAFYHLMTATGAFAGTFFILSLLLKL